MRAWLNGEEIKVSDLVVKITTEPVFTERIYFKGVEISNGDHLRIEQALFDPNPMLLKQPPVYTQVVEYLRVKEEDEE